MATDISMCSNALLLIGHSTIASFTDPGAGAEVASNLYETTYENMLTLHRWRFASAKAQLSRLVSSPLNEWDYAYTLPANYLTMIKLYPETDFEIYENLLYSNEPTVSIDYIFKPDESRLPAYFVKLMEFHLAAQFAIPVTDNTSKAEEYRRMFEDQLRRSKFIDSQARPQDPIVDSPFIEVRA
jgi:hypothetical protein